MYTRQGHLTGLVIGSIILLIAICIAMKYCWVFVRRRKHSNQRVIYKHDKSQINTLDNNNLIDITNISNFPYPINVPTMCYQEEIPPQYSPDPQISDTATIQQPVPTLYYNEPDQYLSSIPLEKPPPSYSEIKNYNN